ncbi:MAG: hypothetical protein PF541_08995 [Prolixibacteraceae bacterium]|jgi:hypothetical protein|nr:hypothetical protein [Prolixibacteraceae bacterium]
MTSPEVLKKEERIITIGAVSDPNYFTSRETSWYAVQPVIGYRSGLGSNQEIGLTLYGIWTPGFVVDYKHQIFRSGNFYLSSDVAAFIGLHRSLGFQYDLLFGNRKLYGVIGTNYTLNNYPGNSAFILGLGKEFGEKRRFGLQLNYAGIYSLGKEYNRTANAITIGLKVDLYKIKKKYQNLD